MNRWILFAGSLLLVGCEAPPDDLLAECAIGMSPQTIDGVVEQLESLPERSIPCLLASFERPLLAAAADSPTSTQPGSSEFPRTFLFLGDLVLTTVVSGLSSDQIEFGERYDATRSVKAELKFPIEGVADPYASPRVAEGTHCGVCHRGEEEHPDHPGRFLSRALRPHRDQLVSLGEGALEHLACDDESERCRRWRAIYGFGEVVPTDFGVGFDVLF